MAKIHGILCGSFGCIRTDTLLRREISMTREEFEKGWKHFCKCIDWNHTALDAEAIQFMNEAPARIAEALEEKKS